MDMKNGQTVWIAFATPRSSDGTPYAHVYNAVVVDAENGIVKGHGVVSIIDSHGCETAHATEAESWAWCHDRLFEAAACISAKAKECADKAVRSRPQGLHFPAPGRAPPAVAT